MYCITIDEMRAKRLEIIVKKMRPEIQGKSSLRSTVHTMSEPPATVPNTEFYII